MIRSGSTLQYQIASDLVERYKLGSRLEYFREAMFPEMYSVYQRQVGHKVFKAHLCTAEIQELFGRGEAIGLYSYRDIRDVAVSAMRKFEMSFKELMQKKWLEFAIESGELWRQQPRVFISKYEEMVVDLHVEVLKTAKLLGISVSSLQAVEIAKEYEVERQRIRMKTTQRGIDVKDSFDPHSLLHHNHIFEAEIGGWKKYLTDAEIELLENKFGTWLRNNGYDLAFSQRQ